MARQMIPASEMRRHMHGRAYAALVAAGGYEEAGDAGRFEVHTGDVILHERFEAHLDRILSSGAIVINIALPDDAQFQPGSGRISDPDSIARVAEKNEAEAAMLLIQTIEMKVQKSRDWPDELAVELTSHPTLDLTLWSNIKDIAPWTISRGFSRGFGISPSGFRACARARQAWKAIRTTSEPLADLAARLGFSDQAHMTRAVKRLTGRPPQAWRVSANRFKTQ